MGGIKIEGVKIHENLDSLIVIRSTSVKITLTKFFEKN